MNLNLKHLGKATRIKVQKIEKDNQDGFANSRQRVSEYTSFIYDLPVALETPVIAPKRVFD